MYQKSVNPPTFLVTSDFNWKKLTSRGILQRFFEMLQHMVLYIILWIQMIIVLPMAILGVRTTQYSWYCRKKIAVLIDFKRLSQNTLGHCLRALWAQLPRHPGPSRWRQCTRGDEYSGTATVIQSGGLWPRWDTDAASWEGPGCWMQRVDAEAGWCGSYVNTLN